MKMHLNQRLIKLTKNFPVNGILIDTNKTEEKLTGSSMILEKPMRLSPIKIGGLIMMMLLIANTLMKMQIETFRDFTRSMEHKKKMKRILLINTIPTGRETLMIYLEYQETLQLMISSLHIEN